MTNPIIQNTVNVDNEAFSLKSFFLTFFKNTLFQHSAIYIVASFLKVFIPFLLFPILTHYLTPADYGITATFSILCQIYLIIIGLNSSSALAINFFKMEDETEYKIYIGNSLLIIGISFLVIFFISCFLKSFLARIIKIPEGLFLLIPCVVLGNLFSTFILTLWQVKRKPLSFALFQISQVLFGFMISLPLVIIFKLGWRGVIWSNALTAFIFGLTAIFIICKKNHIMTCFRSHYVKDILKIGVPLIPHSIGGWVMAGIDRFFINSMVNVAATGIYSVGYQVGIVIDLLFHSFNTAWVPFLFGKLKKDNPAINLKIVKFTYLTFIFIVSLSFLLSFAAPLILKLLVAKTFYPASNYVSWITLGSAANAMYYLVVNYIFFAKKTYALACTTVFSGIMHIILNYFLILYRGPIGAAQATTISAILNFGLVWYMSNRVYPMPWSLKSK